jgi:hypothetical protein
LVAEASIARRLWSGVAAAQAGKLEPTGEEMACGLRAHAAGGVKAPALEDQAIVATDYRGDAVGSQGTETAEAGFLECALSLLGAAAQRKLVPWNFTVMTLDHRGEVAPAVGAAME